MTAASTLTACCGRCDTTPARAAVDVLLVELADAEDMARAFEGLFPIATTMRLEGNRYVWTNAAAERAWTGVCRRKALAIDALLAHARAVRDGKAGG